MHKKHTEILEMHKKHTEILEMHKKHTGNRGSTQEIHGMRSISSNK